MWEKLTKKEQEKVKKDCETIGIEIEPFKELSESIDWDKGINIHEFNEKFNAVFKKKD